MYESALKRCFVAKLSLKIDVIGQIGALDFAVIHIIGFLDQTHVFLYFFLTALFHNSFRKS